MKKVIIVTDCKDIAFTEMKYIILSDCEKLGYSPNDVDISLAAVDEFSIINAAFLTRLVADITDKDSVISVVINPQKHRSDRIFGKLPNGATFFGANTGALTWLINDLKINDVYKIKDPGFVTFGGKFVHAPNVAKLVAETPFSEMGVSLPQDQVAKLDLKPGTIAHIDNFGLMKIIGDKLVFKDGDKFKIYKNGKYILDAVFADRMMCLDDNTWSLYNGSSLDMPELGCVRNKHGFEEIGAKIGDVITWEKI
jgi:S-adenosylmethionine hydrolase